VRIFRNTGHRESHGVSRAELLGLMHPGEVAKIGDRGADLLAEVAINEMDAGGLQRARGIEHVRQHRPSGQRHHHLRLGRLHALALAGGEDDHVQRGGRHSMVSAEVRHSRASWRLSW